MKRWLAIVVGLAVAAGWLVLQARPAAPSDRPIELRVWDWWSPTSSEDYQRYFAAVKKRFEQDHPGIRVRYQFVPFSNYVQKLTTAYCGPNPPDVYQCSVAWAQTLWQRGVLLDLTELVARTPELAIEKFLPAAVRHNQSNGRIFGIPIILDAECLIYNLDMFERAGLPTEPEAIKSWQDFRRFARALTGLNDRGEKVFGFGFSGYGTGLTVFSPLLCANGGQFAGGRPIRAMFNSQQGVEVIEFLRQLYYQDQVCPTFSPQLNVEAEFYAQRVAMLVGGTWSGKYIDRETGSYVGPQRPGGLRYRMTNFPPGPSSRTGQRSTVAWGNMMVISRRCKHPEAAWQYIKLVAGLEGCLMRLKYIGQNAPRKDFYELRPEDMPPAWRQRGYPTWQEVVARKPYLATVPQICNSGGKLPSIERRATDRVFRRAYESVMLAANISRQQIRQRLDRAAAKVNRIYGRSGFN